jgi:cytosine/adenosine deaminase-related metal-dependent hydrolase
VIRSYRGTPPGQPWFIHLAEGTDAVAAAEYFRLKALGCVGPNTVLIHGVGLTAHDIADAAPCVRGLVVCPTTNAYLLGQFPPLAAWIAAGGKYALGSDSRLTADGTLLDEEAALNQLFPQVDAPLPPSSESHILGDPRLAHLEPGAYADVIVSEGTDLRLVIRAGVPQFGDPDLMAKFPKVQTVAARWFGKPKSIQIDLARRIHRCVLKEPGLEVDALPSRSFGWLRR